MKKILSIALVIVMMMSMSVTAFAVDPGSENIDSATGYTFPYEKGIDVSVRLDSDGDKIPDQDDPINENERVMVDLSWTDMEFIYSKSWDAYKGETTSEWLESDQYISVTNRSIYEVTATFGYTQINSDYNIEFSVRETEEEGVKGVRTSNATFEGNVLTLSNPTTVTLDKDAYGDNILPWGEIAVNLAEGAKIPEVDSKDAVGTITVTIEANGFVPPVVEPEYDWYQIQGSDSYFEDEAGLDHNVTTNSFITILMTSYPNSYDEDPTNDLYTIKSVSCSDENALESMTVQNESGYMFNTAGTYTVTVIFSLQEVEVTRTLTFNVTEAE